MVSRLGVSFIGGQIKSFLIFQCLDGLKVLSTRNLRKERVPPSLNVGGVPDWSREQGSHDQRFLISILIT